MAFDDYRKTLETNMPRIFTHPDVDLNVNIPKILIRDANWSSDVIQDIVNTLSDKEYDIYLLNNQINDVQWEYGIKDKCRTVLDASKYTSDPAVWLKQFDDDFNPDA